MTYPTSSAAAHSGRPGFGLDREQRDCLEEVSRFLLSALPTGAPTVTGISGAPGCGKSTLASLLCGRLNARGTPAVCLALDDYYLDRPRRAHLARNSHPLFATRGVPGTHDLDRLTHDLVALRNGRIAGLRLRRFDKSADSSIPASRWPALDAAPRYIFLEGWCVGAPGQSDAELATPISAFESRYDPDGVWRKQVNGNAHEYAARAWSRLDRLWYLAVPGWERVVDWRWQQEQHGGSSLLPDRPAVEEFLATFQRIVLHMLATHRQWADISLYADDRHRLRIPEVRR